MSLYRTVTVIPKLTSSKVEATPKLSETVISTGAKMVNHVSVMMKWGDPPIATKENLGCVIVGENLNVELDGTLSAEGTESLSNYDIEQLIGGLI